MTLFEIGAVVEDAAAMGAGLREVANERTKSGVGSESVRAEAAQWLQIQMLAEIARQLSIMNRSSVDGLATDAFLGRVGR